MIMVRHFSNNFVRLQVLSPGENLLEQLDAAKCADLLVLVWDASFNIDPLLRTCLFAQGFLNCLSQSVLNSHTSFFYFVLTFAD